MNVKEVVPLFAVSDMKTSLAFYVDGLGFEMRDKWEDDGIVRWCRLQIGNAGLMLQQFRTEGHDSRQLSENKGEGVSLYFNGDDAVAFYREVSERGIDATEPQVGNRNWVTSINDPDGYSLCFQSPTDVPEETKLSDSE
jgi:catechol 2,3-dioxygenase-like lactoylglutathione lyase family enzyme